jgi:hypothetical protein
MVISSAHTPAPPAETLPGTLAIAGREARVRVLVALCALGTIGAVAIAIFVTRRSWWVLTTPFALLATFGGWGLTEQANAAIARLDIFDPTERRVLHATLRTAGVLLVITGAAAFTILVFAITFFLAGAAPIL